MGSEADFMAGLGTSRERLEERLRRLGEIRREKMYPSENRTPETRKQMIVAEAQALAMLVVADEVRALRKVIEGDTDRRRRRA